MRKKAIIILVLLFFSLLTGVFCLSEWIFPQWNGSSELGNNLYLLDWEKNGKIIVYCGSKKGNTCYGGVPVIPHNSPSEVWVKNAISNKKWVIVKAVQTQSKKELFYLINNGFNVEGLDWEQVNCDSIIQSFIFQFQNINDLTKELEQRKIDLRFPNEEEK